MIRLENIVQHYGVRPVLAGIDPSRLIDHVERLLRLFELDEQGDWPIRSFSNGQQKKIALSAALATDARIMLLDEPFAGGLDPSGILALVLGQFTISAFKIPAPLGQPDVVSVCALILLAVGPSVRNWELTGGHRITSLFYCNKGSQFIRV